MTVNRRLLDAMHTHDVNYKEYLEKAKILDGSAGAERVKLQNELAEWVEETFPLRTYKYPLGREATETEMHMMNTSASLCRPVQRATDGDGIPLKQLWDLKGDRNERNSESGQYDLRPV